MTYTGIAAFAAMNKKFPTKKVLKSYPKDIKKPGTAILFGFFGKEWKFPTAFCKKFADRPHCIEWHLCFRNPIAGLQKKAKLITRKMAEIGNENTKFIICPVLEDACTDAKFEKIANQIRKVTDAEIVRNPCMGGKIVGPYDYEEHHGGHPTYKKAMKSRIYNPDGMSVDFKDGDKYFNRMSVDHFESIINNQMFMWLIWYAPLQGFKNSKSFADKPPMHKRKYLLSRKASKGMKSILKRN